ncbi:MAG TPA: hypothetical protein VFW98_11950 [Gemmatimonadaceae bacterium]|nr:hypothetical protein [Gemmatimonadaceae bacterium]
MPRRLFVAAAALMALAGCRDSGKQVASASATGPSCPLSASERTRAFAEFTAMMPAFSHPRCANCHGGIDVFAPSAQQTHDGGQIASTTIVDSSDFKMRLGPVHVFQQGDVTACQDCHDVPGWVQPSLSLAFAGRTTTQICKQVKGRDTPSVFAQHIHQDPLLLAGFAGRRGQNDLSPEPPPLSLADFQKYATAWMRLVEGSGDKWKGGRTSDCGCVSGAERLRVTEHIREQSDRYGVEKDLTYVAELVMDSTGDFSGDGTYSGTVETFKLNCFNSAPDKRQVYHLQGHLTGDASIIDLGSQKRLSYNLVTTDWPVKLTVFSFGTPTQDDIDAGHKAGAISTLMVKLHGPKTVIHNHTVDDGRADHMSGCVKQVSHDDDMTIELLGGGS